MKRTRALIALALTLVLPPAQAFAVSADDIHPVSVPGLITIDRELDGAMVRFTGEAIGEDLHADADHRWVNVLSEGTAVGVYVTNEQAAQIEVYGDYGSQGAIVEVVGNVNVGCDQHAGEFDVHATEFTVISPGATVEHPVVPAKAVAAGIALALALLEARLYRRMLDRRGD